MDRIEIEQCGENMNKEDKLLTTMTIIHNSVENPQKLKLGDLYKVIL